MAVDLCLTVSTNTEGGYWVGHPSCSGIQKRVGQSCAGNIIEGDTINLTAFPDSNYFVSNWDVQSSTGVVPSLTLSGSGIYPSSQTASFVYLAEHGDVDIVVSFTPFNCDLKLAVGSSSGSLDLEVPSGKTGTIHNSSTLVTIDASAGDSTDIRVKATPDAGYSISGWTLDGVSYDSDFSSPPEFSTAGYTTRSIVVNFEPDTACVPDKQLSISISGSGSVTASNGLYCDGEVLNIIPIPAIGWVFSRWDYDATAGIAELNGNILRVVMDVDRTNITAIFIKGAEAESKGNLFYCPSDNYKNNIVSFNFTNSENDNDPSVDNLYHFRVNFYTDINKDKLVYSSFSLADNKRWFLEDESFSQLPSDGVDVDINQTVSIIYDPEVLPSQITETQKSHLVNDDQVIYEKPLLCGVKYYVEIQAYEVDTNSIIDISTIPLILSCNSVDSYYWDYNKDKNNWICSGQGKMDLKVCEGFEQALNPSVSSNLFGNFKVVWQGRRVFRNNQNEVVKSNNIYSAKWDSNTDILNSSGQGLYDYLEMDDGNNPIVITDPALNFYFSSVTRDNIKYKQCDKSFGSGDNLEDDSDVIDESSFEDFCYPGSASLLSSVYDEIKMRIYDQDISGSLTINKDKVVPVVSKRAIRLDVDGIVGAYAVRIRNMDESSWGDWINIDNTLYNGGTGDDKNYDAYKIDNNRFLVQWNVKKYNGLRRICCQVLTTYGISNTFCVEFLAKFTMSQHVFKFYKDENRENEFPMYNGQYVLSINAPDSSSDGEKVTVYFDAVFNQPIYKDEVEKIPYEVDDVEYNLIQQGINDKRNQKFTSITDNKFSGQFEVSKNDGIFNKDGKAFIEILFPDNTNTKFCESDERDIYNVVNTDMEDIVNIDLLPEDAYQKYQRDRLSKPLDINSFKQNYDKDDDNFKFGNPGYYRE